MCIYAVTDKRLASEWRKACGFHDNVPVITGYRIDLPTEPPIAYEVMDMDTGFAIRACAVGKHPEYARSAAHAIADRMNTAYERYVVKTLWE